MSIDLFKPYKIGKLELKNRFVRSPVGDRLADDYGNVTDESIAFYKKLAEGGVGLIEAGHVTFTYHGQIAPRGGHRFDSEDKIAGWNRIVQEVHKSGAKIALQLAHAGGSSDHFMFIGTTLAVSDSPALNRFSPSAYLGQSHRVMTNDEIEAIIDAFATAAKRVVKAGFDAVNLSASGRYICGQFLSSLFNLRTDKWGGSLENRMRFALEVLRRTRLAVGPDFPILVKGDLKDPMEGGFTLEEGIETFRQMAVNGANILEVTGVPASLMGERPGVNWGIGVAKPEHAYARADAAALKRVVSVPIILNGGIRSLELAQAIVDSGDADMISFAQPFTREKDLIARWERGDRKPARCITCDRCWGMAHSGQREGCGEELRIEDQLHGI